MTTGNETFLDDAALGVTITSTQAQFGGTMYPIAGITAVQTAKIPAERGSPIILAILGVLMAAGGISAESGPVVGGGAIFAAVGGIAAALAKNNYVLRIATAGGQVTALESKDPDVIARVSLALKQAVAARR